MSHTSPNIMGFAARREIIQGRRITFWWIIVVCSVVMLLGSALLNHVFLNTIHRSLSTLQTIIPDIAQSSALQHIALTAVQSYRSQQAISKSKVLELYEEWYEEQCLTDLSNPSCQLFVHREELLEYLGYSQPKTYLILLQNSAEVRPNGGFYGSFVRLTLSGGMIEDMSLHDSYEVLYAQSGVQFTLPERTSNYLGDNIATFIAGNKFGFTNRDGLVITAIYEKTYDTTIDGIIFVSTDTLLTLVPSIQTRLREWQFVNASVDLIRGHSGSYKKELYMNQLNTYLNTNKVGLLTQAYDNINKLFAPSMMQVYLPLASEGLRNTLLGFGRITTVQPEHMYARDLNQSYNKISNFVSKEIVIVDNEGEIVQHSSTPIIDGSKLPGGQYQLQIQYDLDVPQYYIRTIRHFEQFYGISLTDREEHILGLTPVYEYKSVVFAGTGIILDGIIGDIDQTKIFDAPPGQAVAYHVPTSTGSTKVTIIFSKLDIN